MILMICLALGGAALGAFLRPRLLAVAFAAGLAAASRAGPLFLAALSGGKDDSPNWGGDVVRFMESPLTGYLIVVSACAGAALFAALLTLFLEEAPSRPFWMPPEGDARLRDRTGRFIRAAEMIEERSIHNRAEANIRAHFDR